MRIPPYYRHPVWQRFFAGMAIGGIISWFIFLYIFGEWHEKYSKEIKTQKEEIDDLRNDVKIWQEDFKELNKANRQKLTVQDIRVKIQNSDKYKLDLFSVYEIEDELKEDIKMMMAKDIETVYKSRDLIEKTIENRVLKVNEKRYRVQVRKMVIYTNLSIEVDIMLD